jgi:hypothetical protein
MKTNKGKMRKITINLAAVVAFCIVVASPALVSSSCATPQTEQEDTTIIREDSGITALKYSSPEVPASIEFCGKTIDLSRFDRHERMDRELLAFTYMHSTSLQMLKKANRYFPIVEPILKENGIPDDFKYLMVIESNMNPTARSSAGAAGEAPSPPAGAADEPVPRRKAAAHGRRSPADGGGTFRRRTYSGPPGQLI